MGTPWDFLGFVVGNSRDGESVPRDPMLHDRDFPGLAGPAVATATGAATRTRRGVAGVRTILCWHSWRRMGVGCRQALFVCGVDHCCYKANLSLYSSRAFAHATSSSSLGSFSLTEFCSIPLLAYSPATNPQLPRDAFPCVV